VHERLNVNEERQRLLQRCYAIREAIERQRLRNDRDALDQDLEGSSGAPTDAQELRSRDLSAPDHAV